MSRLFPDELVRQFARGRTATLKLRCTCRSYRDIVAAVPWMVRLVINCKDGGTVIINHPHCPEDGPVLFGRGGLRVSRCTLLSDGVTVHSSRTLSAGTRYRVITCLAREYMLAWVELSLPVDWSHVWADCLEPYAGYFNPAAGMYFIPAANKSLIDTRIMSGSTALLIVFTDTPARAYLANRWALENYGES